MTEQEYRGVVTDVHLDVISRICCTDGGWDSLAIHLGMPRSSVDDIEREQTRMDAKRRRLFFRWRQEDGSDATYEKLVVSLLKIRHRQDAEEVLKLLQETKAVGKEMDNGGYKSNALRRADIDLSIILMIFALIMISEFRIIKIRT